MVFGSLSADFAAVYETPGCFTSFNSYLDLSILYCSHGILEPNMGRFVFSVAFFLSKFVLALQLRGILYRELIVEFLSLSLISLY